MKSWWIIQLILLVLSGCTHEQKLQRAERKITKLTKRFPELVTIDTASVLDTTIVPGIDTFFVQQFLDGDTMHFFDTVTETTVKTVINNDTIYQSVTAPSDTVVKTIRVPFEKIVTQQQPLTFYERAALFAGKYISIPLLILIFFLVWFLSQKRGISF